MNFDYMIDYRLINYNCNEKINSWTVFFIQASKPAEIGEAMMKKAVDLLARQTVAGLGGTAMKTCLAYIKNALTKPEVCNAMATLKRCSGYVPSLGLFAPRTLSVCRHRAVQR